MNTDRSAILSLVAMGRISPREAERLLAVSWDADDSILRLALCLAFVWLVLPQVGTVANSVGRTLPALLPAIERVILALGGMA